MKGKLFVGNFHDRLKLQLLVFSKSCFSGFYLPDHVNIGKGRSDIMSPIEFTISVQFCNKSLGSVILCSLETAWGRWTNREFYQKHFLDHSAFCLLLEYSKETVASESSQGKIPSWNLQREKDWCKLFGEWNGFLSKFVFDERLSVVCIEDAFETYLPASMIPSEKVIRLENRISIPDL